VDNWTASESDSQERFKDLRVENRGNRYASVWMLASKHPHFPTGFPHSALKPHGCLEAPTK